MPICGRLGTSSLQILSCCFSPSRKMRLGAEVVGVLKTCSELERSGWGSEVCPAQLWWAVLTAFLFGAWKWHERSTTGPPGASADGSPWSPGRHRCSRALKWSSRSVRTLCERSSGTLPSKLSWRCQGPAFGCDTKRETPREFEDSHTFGSAGECAGAGG